MQATGFALAPGQGHVQRLGAQLLLEFGVGQCAAALREGLFHRLLGLVDGRAASLLLLDAERGHPFHQLGDAAGLADVQRLGILELGGRGRLGEGLTRGVDDGIEILAHAK